MIETVSAFELYYDSTAVDPKEDPEELRARLAALADRNGIEYVEVDTAGYAPAEREALYRRLADSVTEEEHDVGPRVFTDAMFARLRPVLVVRYGDGRIDLVPHRNDAESGVPIPVRAFLEALEVAAGEAPSPRQAA